MVKGVATTVIALMVLSMLARVGAASSSTTRSTVDGGVPKSKEHHSTRTTARTLTKSTSLPAERPPVATTTATPSKEPFDAFTETSTVDGGVPKSKEHRSTRTTTRTLTNSVPKGHASPPSNTPGDVQGAPPGIDPAVVATFLVPSVCGVVAIVALCLWYRLRKQRRHAITFTHAINTLEDGCGGGHASDDVSLSISVGTRTTTTSSAPSTLNGMMPFDYYASTYRGSTPSDDLSQKEPISQKV